MKLNAKEKEIIKKALEIQKSFIIINIEDNLKGEKREKAIDYLNDIESVEKKLKG